MLKSNEVAVLQAKSNFQSREALYSFQLVVLEGKSCLAPHGSWGHTHLLLLVAI